MKRVVVVGTGSQPESCLGEAAGGLGDGAGAMKDVRKGGNTQVPGLGTIQIEPPFRSRLLRESQGHGIDSHVGAH